MTTASSRGVRSTGSGRAVRPHEKVLLVGTVFVVGAVSVLALSLALISSVRGQLAGVPRQALLAQDALTQTSVQIGDARAALGDAARATDQASRTALLQRALDSTNAGLSSWRRYQRHALDRPGERAEQARFDAAAASAREVGPAAGLAILATPERETLGPNADIAKNLGLLDQQLEQVNRLQERYYEPAVAEALASVRSQLATAERDVVVTFAVFLVLGFSITAVSARAAFQREARSRQEERERVRTEYRNSFDARLGHGLAMATGEDAALDVCERALREILDTRPAELLLADSSRAHYRRVLSTAADPESGCDVSSPGDCPASTRGQVLVFESSEGLDACPHLRGREPECSAVCVPVSIGGRPVGTLHTTDVAHRPPDADRVADLELLARKLGERITLVRAIETSETQARTDPLTGLLNRRSLDNRVRDLDTVDGRFVIAFGDLDHFKELNDVHGHDVGDRALRLFARVLRDALRPADLASRYGGEEFVVVLPDCTIPDAVSVIERVREQLALALTSATLPRFTVSFGVAMSDPTEDLVHAVSRADTALLEAKRAGRNRVMVVSEEAPA